MDSFFAVLPIDSAQTRLGMSPSIQSSAVMKKKLPKLIAVMTTKVPKSTRRYEEAIAEVDRRYDKETSELETPLWTQKVHQLDAAMATKLPRVCSGTAFGIPIYVTNNGQQPLGLHFVRTKHQLPPLPSLAVNYGRLIMAITLSASLLAFIFPHVHRIPLRLFSAQPLAPNYGIYYAHFIRRLPLLLFRHCLWHPVTALLMAPSSILLEFLVLLSPAGWFQ
ncbi:hypothetical protein niasHT_025814 [Heterodera trifolii]|uniref:Uncharacterized protein n=1 Tax=Heterodera trifolii TaxID=157864 RepID=A0ABD2KSZ1_9BILA